MALADIDAHDAVIHRVIELSDTDDLLFEVDYCVDWEASRFESRVIVVRDLLQYRVDEIAFSGVPTILSIENSGEVDGRLQLIIKTNAGDRYLLCRDVELRSPE